MKKNAIIAAMGAAFAVTGVQASTGTINFTGTVSAQTCAASVGGTAAPAAATVALPAVQANSLSAAAATAGRTAFQISLTGCAAANPAGAGTVKALFENGAGVDSNGRLANTGSANNVVLQLLDGTTNAVINAGNASQNTGGYVNISAGAATLPYSVQYYATGVATAGNVASSVTYSLIYQ
ncbi:fimbrial protein [Enterobacter soli]|jgi:major type 1 subunit fimbrin (pilin)